MKKKIQKKSGFFKKNPYIDNVNEIDNNLYVENKSDLYLFINLIKMSKIKMGTNEFEYTPTISPEDFVAHNIGYYSEKYLENNPTMAYAINDGDLECVYDSIDYEEVAELMTELYREFLIDNYGY